MRIFFLSCFTLLLMGTVFLRSSWAETPQSLSGISERLDRLTAKIKAIEEKQEEILSAQNEVIQEIKDLKILAHRK